MSKIRMSDITEVTEADPHTVLAEHHWGERDVLTNGIAGGKAARLSAEAADGNGVVSVPVSLPVGTIITTFNVITSEHIKPMLCVDNGFILGGGVGDDLKTAHQVLANDKLDKNDSRDNQHSWINTARMPVLPICCNNTSADLHKNKFGSGGRGKCIKYGNDWYTPSEFEALCGRAASKDWKKSIRFGGRTLKALVDEGILTPHAFRCTCGACRDNQSDGPIILFSLDKKRKNHYVPDPDEALPKVNRITSLRNSGDIDTIDEISINSRPEEEWPTLVEDLDSNNNYALLTDTSNGSRVPTTGN